MGGDGTGGGEGAEEVGVGGEVGEVEGEVGALGMVALDEAALEVEEFYGVYFLSEGNLDLMASGIGRENHGNGVGGDDAFWVIWLFLGGVGETVLDGHAMAGGLDVDGVFSRIGVEMADVLATGDCEESVGTVAPIDSDSVGMVGSESERGAHVTDGISKNDIDIGLGTLPL